MGLADTSIVRDRPALSHALAALLPAILFGVAVAAQWQTQELGKQITVRHNTELSDSAQGLQDEQAGLKEQIAALRSRLGEIQKTAASQSDAVRELQAQVEDLRLRAGMTAVSGSGVVVHLEVPKPVAGREPERPVCHSTDLIDVVNAAWRGGADAVAIGSERVVTTTSIYCVGATVLVNGSVISGPFDITVVGRPDALLATFEDPAQLRDLKRRDVLRVLRGLALTVPAYSGALSVRFAVPR